MIKHLVIGALFGFIAAYCGVSIFYVLAGIIFYYILSSMLKFSRKNLSQITIDEMDSESYSSFTERYQNDLDELIKLNFEFFDAFKCSIGSIRIITLIYRYHDENLYAVLHYYPNDKKIFYPLFYTYFSENHSLATTNSKYLQSEPFLKDNFYQYIPDASYEEMLNYQQKGTLYIEKRYSESPLEFSPLDFRNRFINDQKKAAEKMGLFPYFTVLKASISNDLTLYQKPIVLQLSR